MIFARFLPILEGGYFRWPIVAFYIVVVGVFTWGILRPRTPIQWWTTGMAYGWLTALFAEMYGLPLSMYLLAWLTGQLDYVDDHFHGHAWAFLFGWGERGATASAWVTRGIIAVAMLLICVAWRQLYRGSGRLMRDGLYSRVRHPQYAGLLLFMIGCLMNWPTVLTLLMFPVLAATYYRLAKCEEAEALVRFGEEYRAYQQATGMFWPVIRSRRLQQPKPRGDAQ